MQKLKEYLKKGGQLHHCYILVGDTKKGFLELETFCQEALDFSFQGNRNFSIYEYENLLIEDARNFLEMKSRKISNNEIHISVIVCQNITREAQNSLLKILEEPITGNYFFILIPTYNLLLPTIISRASVIFLNNTSSFSEEFEKIRKNYQEILKIPYKDRMILVNKIMDLLKKEKVQRTEIDHYIFSLASEMNETFLESPDKLEKTLPRVQSVIKYVDKRGSSLKTILEYLMLLIPNSDIIKI